MRLLHAPCRSYGGSVMNDHSTRTDSPAQAYTATVDHPEAVAWRRFGGRHTLECWLSRPYPSKDGRRSGYCFCGNRCPECADSFAGLAALGMTPMGRMSAGR